MLFGQYGIHEKREFIKRLCTRLTQDAKAEPAERVTDPAVETVCAVDFNNIPGFWFNGTKRVHKDVAVKIVAAVRKADAQGGKHGR